MSTVNWHPLRPAVTACGLATMLLLGCNSESAPLWELTDPGGGGAAPAVYQLPGTRHLFVGSDVGGFRYSSDAGVRFSVINEGVDFESSAGDNIQDITGYSIGEYLHVVGSATAGLLYWRSIGPDGLAPEWVRFFDSRQAERDGATTFGPLAVDPSGQFLYAGIGNMNNLALNRLTELDRKISGRIYIFRTRSDGVKTAPPQPAGFVSLPAVCDGLTADPYLHITDLAAVDIGGKEYLIAGSSKGLMVLSEPRSNTATCRHLLIPDHNANVLSARPSTSDPRDVVVLINETGLDRQQLKAERKSRNGDAKSNLGGGLFHTTDVLAASPDWQDITPQQARGEDVGKLERGNSRPGELVLSGDASATMGVLFTPDFTREKWRTAIDRSLVSKKGSNRDFDGWRRYNSSLKGVKEIAFEEFADGISTLYVSGFQGMLLSGRRAGDDFRFSQSYTNATRDGDSLTYHNRGLPLMNPWQAITDARHPDQTIFLYHDNIFFVGDNLDSSFRRPLAKFGWGTDVVFDPQVARIFVSYSIGNHLESGRRKTAQRGGIMVGIRDATEWQEFSPRLPETGPVESLAMFNGELCASAYRKGVFCTSIRGEIRPDWHRITPEAIEVLHMIDGPDTDNLIVVDAAGQSRRMCQLTSSGRNCSALPVDASEFERLWLDEDRLWLSTGKGRTYTSKLQEKPAWDAVDVDITDLRSLAFGDERVSIIASGAEGLFASRTPQNPDSWCPVSRDGLNGNRVVKSIADPAGGEYLHIALAGVGFYRASLDDLAAELSRSCR